MATFVMFLSADGYQQPIIIDPSKVCAVRESMAQPGAVDIFVGGGEPITVGATLDTVFTKLRIELAD